MDSSKSRRRPRTTFQAIYKNIAGLCLFYCKICLYGRKSSTYFKTVPRPLNDSHRRYLYIKIYTPEEVSIATQTTTSRYLKFLPHMRIFEIIIF